MAPVNETGLPTQHGAAFVMGCPQCVRSSACLDGLQIPSLNSRVREGAKLKFLVSYPLLMHRSTYYLVHCLMTTHRPHSTMSNQTQLPYNSRLLCNI